MWKQWSCVVSAERTSNGTKQVQFLLKNIMIIFQAFDFNFYLKIFSWILLHAKQLLNYAEQMQWHQLFFQKGGRVTQFFLLEKHKSFEIFDQEMRAAQIQNTQNFWLRDNWFWKTESFRHMIGFFGKQISSSKELFVNVFGCIATVIRKN